MKAYLNNPTLKAQLIEQITAHRAADHLMRGTYVDNRNGYFVGCAVGCSIDSLNRLTGSTYSHNDHSCYEPGFGVPQILARLQDSLFENLPDGEHLDWPLAFWQAVPVGADLTMVWPRFAHWLLVDSEDGVLQFVKGEQSKTAIEEVAKLYQLWIDGDKPESKEWIAAAYAAAASAASANAAAASAYASAASAASANAAASASAYASDAYAAAYAARASAYAAAANAYASAARASAADLAAARRKQAAKLLELIAVAPLAA